MKPGTKTALRIPTVANMLAVFEDIDRVKAGHALIYASGLTGISKCETCGQRFRYCITMSRGHPQRTCYDCTTSDIFR